MEWLFNVDVSLFRFINHDLMNPVFDAVMPFLSGNSASFRLLYALLLAAAVWLIWKDRSRGIVFVLMLALVLAIGDGLICNTLKHAVARPRPFLVLPDVHCLAGQGHSGSMPSSHAANWFAATMVAFIYYRRTVWVILPLAGLVAFSRVYNGVHFPSDVLAGAILGAGYAGAIVWMADAAWHGIGQKWFPLWWKAFPSLLNPRPLRTESDENDESELPQLPRVRGRAEPGFRPPHASPDQHWLRLGYVVIAVLFLARLFYIAGGTIQLSEDEAYQWLWSKHLALSYYSKPPLIAYTQFLGTHLWGDTVLGVRFFSPIIGAVIGLVMLRFFAREVNARAGFFLLLIVTATPLMSAGAVLMTIDPLSVLFWTAAMLAGWKAIQDNSRTRDWLWVGLWMGLGFLSKYTELFQWLCWAVLFFLWKPARKQLRRPGPWFALGINVLCALPVLIWNAQHDWITVSHVADDAGASKDWHLTYRFVGEFLGGELGLLNPVFFVAVVWACIMFWRRGRHNPKLVYFFSMGAPLFLAYLFHSLHSRVLLNWIAPSVLPLLCLMTLYWDTRLRLGSVLVKVWLTVGLVLGFVAVLFLHNTDFSKKLTGSYLPLKFDPLHRVRVWSNVAQVAGQERQDLLKEGKPVFIIGNHYGIVGLISFYLPEAREHVSDTPLVYYRTSVIPRNQFYFWPGYSGRKGENAIFVEELDRDDLMPLTAPAEVVAEFESVTEIGVRQVLYHGQLCRPLRVFACRGLK